MIAIVCWEGKHRHFDECRSSLSPFICLKHTPTFIPNLSLFRRCIPSPEKQTHLASSISHYLFFSLFVLYFCRNNTGQSYKRNFVPKKHHNCSEYLSGCYLDLDHIKIMTTKNSGYEFQCTRHLLQYWFLKKSSQNCS